jgi:hypothetical protein
MTWNVYTLRKRGIRLDRDDILKEVKRGTLVILPDGSGTARARLEHHAGFDLCALHAVSIRRMLAGGEIMLHGKEMIQTRHGFEEFPQAWWCVPGRL